LSWLNLCAICYGPRSIRDNHRQEDSRAESAWREARLFGNLGIILLH
jgi:hypothetical protein